MVEEVIGPCVFSLQFPPTVQRIRPNGDIMPLDMDKRPVSPNVSLRYETWLGTEQGKVIDVWMDQKAHLKLGL